MLVSCIDNVDPTEVCSCLIILHCSLRGNNVTDTGAIALAGVLERSKSLEELKSVMNLAFCYCSHQVIWRKNV